MDDLTRDRALRCLKLLRRGTREFGGFLRTMKECLRAENITLTDIGTSEEELARLKLLSHKICALDHFNTLRCGAASPEMEVQLLRGHLAAAGLNLQDIGTNEEELTTLSERIF
jgi:hypothetical protein